MPQKRVISNKVCISSHIAELPNQTRTAPSFAKRSAEKHPGALYLLVCSWEREGQISSSWAVPDPQSNKVTESWPITQRDRYETTCASFHVKNHVVYLSRPPAVGHFWLVGNKCFFTRDLYCSDLVPLSSSTCFPEIRWEEIERAWLVSASAASPRSPASYPWGTRGWITISQENLRLNAGSCWSAINWVLHVW